MDKERGDLEAELARERIAGAKAGRKLQEKDTSLKEKELRLKEEALIQSTIATQTAAIPGLRPDMPEAKSLAASIRRQITAGVAPEQVELPPDVLQLQAAATAERPRRAEGEAPVARGIAAFFGGREAGQRAEERVAERLRLAGERAEERGAVFEERGAIGVIGSELEQLLRRPPPQEGVTRGPRVTAEQEAQGVGLDELLQRRRQAAGQPPLTAEELTTIRGPQVIRTPEEVATRQTVARVNGAVEGLAPGVPLQPAKLTAVQAQIVTEGVTLLPPTGPGQRQANRILANYSARPTERNEAKAIQQLDALVTQQQQIGFGGINVQEANLARQAIANFNLANLLNLQPLQPQ